MTDAELAYKEILARLAHLDRNERALKDVVARLMHLEREVYHEDFLARRLTALAERMAKHGALFPALVDRWISEIEAIRDGKPELPWQNYPEMGDAAELNNRTILLEKLRTIVEEAVLAKSLEGQGLSEIEASLGRLREALEHPVNPVDRPAGMIQEPFL